jgi:hypothetical protein
MFGPYTSAEEHLDDVVAFVKKLLERHITAHWEFGWIPREAGRFAGGMLTSGDVRTLLAGTTGTPEGMQQLQALDYELAELEKKRRARIDATVGLAEELPLMRLSRVAGLSPTEERVMWIALAAEVSPPVRHVLRYLANEPERAQLDIGLLEVLVYSSSDVRPRLLEELTPESRLNAYRIIETSPSPHNRTFMRRLIRIEPRVVELAHGVLGLDRSLTRSTRLVSPKQLDDLIVSDDLRAKTNGLLAQSVAHGPGVLLSGRAGAGRRSLLVSAALSLGFDTLLVDCGALAADADAFEHDVAGVFREAMLLNAIPVFLGIDSLAVEGQADTRGVRLNRALSSWPGAFAATSGTSESVPIGLDRGLVRISVPAPTEGERIQLWKRELQAVAKPDLDYGYVAGRYAATGGTIIRAAASARAIASARGGQVTDDDIHEGLRSVSDEQFALGKRVTRRQRWEDVVLPQDILDTLKEFVARVRHRKQVYEEWGFAEKMARGLGVSALFSGPPGTGKTMVAGIIADELGLDLYQIDLSRVVSKYIGETEKNLGRLFDAAETGHAILLFDEADSLFAKRGEVKSSVDRYANLEVNYLLQRMEAFDGITILTTNLAASLDDAFRRRLSIKLEFPLPEADEREKLWQSMLPAKAVSKELDLKTLAQRFEMSGGYIRNAVLRAAFLAAAENRSIQYVDLKRAAELEYSSMGKIA